MKKIVVIVLAVAVMLGMAVPGYCGTMVEKLGRGIANVVTCPMEIVNQISKANQENGWVAASTYGLLKGIVMTPVRAVVGAYEIVSFPIPAPADYQPILTDPQYFFSDWGA